MDFIVTDTNGEVLCSMVDFEVEKHRTALTSSPGPQRSFDLIYQPIANSPIDLIERLGGQVKRDKTTDEILDDLVKHNEASDAVSYTVQRGVCMLIVHHPGSSSGPPQGD